MLKKLRDQRDALLQARATHEASIKAIVKRCEDHVVPAAGDVAEVRGRDLTADEAVEARTARDAKAAIDTQVEALSERIAELEGEEKRDAAADALRAKIGTHGPAVVTHEARTYSTVTQREGTSFFGDAYRAEFRSDRKAAERIERHMREVEVEQESRATTTTSYAGLVVPQYLVGLYAPILRVGRPFANAINRLPLPDEGTVLRIPRATTGASAASQATENAAVSSTDQVDADLIINMVTIAGQQDISRQSLERGTPGIDSIVYQDLARAYCAELDRQALNGSGASGQMLGALQTAGKFAATVFGAAATATTFYSKLAGMIGAVSGAGTMVEPALIVMHPRRWAWHQAQVDSAGRPLVVPGSQVPYNAQGINSDPGGYSGDGDGMGGGYKVVGTIQGLPVVTDANIPINLGGGTLEDIVLVLDPTQALLWEQGDGMPTQLRFEQTLGNQLTTKLVVYGYAAFTAGRYPQAFGTVGGADGTSGFGLTTPAF